MNKEFATALENAAHEKIRKGEDFLYEGTSPSIKWVQLIEFLQEVYEESKANIKDSEDLEDKNKKENTHNAE